MRIALGVEYDGRRFCGWQSQPGGCGVQDALERALSGICGHPVRIAGAGRTDSGVHASGQVAHFETSSDRPLTAWTRGGNSALPAGVPPGAVADFTNVYVMLHWLVRNSNWFWMLALMK